jgi:hypothetical protein
MLLDSDFMLELKQDRRCCGRTVSFEVGGIVPESAPAYRIQDPTMMRQIRITKSFIFEFPRSNG